MKNAGQLYLVEDPLFDVNIDFLVPFQENPDQFDLNRHLLHDEVLVTDTIRVLEDYEVSEEGEYLKIQLLILDLISME